MKRAGNQRRPTGRGRSRNLPRGGNGEGGGQQARDP